MQENNDPYSVFVITIKKKKRIPERQFVCLGFMADQDLLVI